MNKGLIIASVFFVALALILVSAENGDRKGPIERDKNFSEKQIRNESGGGEGRGFALGIHKIKNERGDDMEVEKGERLQLRVRNITAHSDLNITPEDDLEQNRTRLRVHFPNGKNSEIKIMPDSANERALERLKLNFCNVNNNCTIQLKETGKGDQMRASYEVQAERHFKLLGMFDRKAQVRAEVDAETGEVTSVGKPWWSFLASQPAE